MSEKREALLFELARNAVAEHYGIPVKTVTGLGILGEDHRYIRYAQFSTLCKLYNHMLDTGVPCALEPWMISSIPSSEEIERMENEAKEWDIRNS